MTAKEFKTYMDELGMSLISTHCNPDFTMMNESARAFKTLVDASASIGLKSFIVSFLGPLKTSGEWKKAAEGLNRQGEICAKAGLKA